MHKGWRRNTEFCRSADDRFEERKTRRGNAAGAAKLAFDDCFGRRIFDVALGIVKFYWETALNSDPINRLNKIHPPVIASKVAVGNTVQADLLLHLHDLADRFILQSLERVDRQFTLFHLLTRLYQSLGTQQAANVIGSEGRFVVISHIFILSL